MTASAGGIDENEGGLEVVVGAPIAEAECMREAMGGGEGKLNVSRGMCA